MRKPSPSIEQAETPEVMDLLKFYRYLFNWENYQLLSRTIQAAWLVRQSIKEDSISPRLSTALTALDGLYLPPQKNWKISDPEKIAKFAAFIVKVPVKWGRCVQQSLITYRLLNGYGIPARVCYGISRDNQESEGHAWVVRVDQPDRPFAEATDPRERFITIFVSPLPEQGSGVRDQGSGAGRQVINC